MSDLLPATDGLFLGSDSKRWDGSKLINLPGGGGGDGPFLWSSALCYQLGGPSSGTIKYYAFLAEFYSQGSSSDSLGLTNPPRFVFASTIKKWGINVSTNALTGTATFTVRKNQADTGLVITFAAGETGFKSLTQDLALADGDVINYKCNAIDAPSTNRIYFQSVIKIQAG